MAERRGRAEILLDDAFSQSNGPPLGYKESYHYDIRRQVLDFIEAYPGPKLKVGNYVTNDGANHKLLLFEGVIPIHYKNATYNVPLYIWLTLNFPIAAPVVYVKCDADKFIYNAKCRIVDSSNNGRVTTEYLRNWGYPNSNLEDLVGDLRISFAEFPPLYTRQPGQGTAVSTSSNSNSGGSGTIFNPFGANARPPQQQQQQQIPPPPAVVPPAAGASIWAGVLSQQTQQTLQAAQAQRKEMLKSQRAAAYHLALTTALSARLGGALDAAAAAEKEHQLTIQAELQSRSTLVANEVTKLQKEREALDAAAHELSASGAALDSWLKINEPRAQSVRAAVDGEIDPDEAIVPADPLSQQAVVALSADMALEDTLAVLDRALEGKKVPLSVYLGQVRAVSRKQFTARALSSKITSKQLTERAPQANMNRPGGASASGSASTLYPSVLAPSSGGTAGAPPPPPRTDQWQTSGGVLLNPLAAAAKNMR